MTATDGVTAAPANGVRAHEEYQYLDLVREILEQGEKRLDRYVHQHSPAILFPLRSNPVLI
jgi:hypothetical protein